MLCRPRQLFCTASARTVQAFLTERIPAERFRVQQTLEELFSVNFYELGPRELVDTLEQLGRVAFAQRGEDKASKLAFKVIPPLLLRATEDPPDPMIALRLLAPMLHLRVFSLPLLTLLSRSLCRERTVPLCTPLITALQALLLFHDEAALCLELFDELAARVDWHNSAEFAPARLFSLTQFLVLREVLERVRVKQRPSSLEAVIELNPARNTHASLRETLVDARNAVMERHGALSELLCALEPGAEVSKALLASFLKLAPLLFPEALEQVAAERWRVTDLLPTPALALSRFYGGQGRRLLHLGLATLPFVQKMADFALQRSENADLMRCFADRTTKIGCNEELFDRLLRTRTAAVEKNALRYIYEVDLLVGGRHALEIDSPGHAFHVLSAPGERPALRPSLARALPRLLTLGFFGVERHFSFLSAEHYRETRATGESRPERHIYENVLCPAALGL